MFSLIIDIAIALVACIIIVRHTRLGFVKSILGSLKPLIAGALAFIFRVPVAKIFVNLLSAPVNNWVHGSLSASAAGTDAGFDLVSLYQSCPMVYEKVLKFFGLDTENGFRDSMANITQLDEAGLGELSLNISTSITWALSLGIAMVVIFIISLIVLSILTMLLDMVTRITLIKVVNRILGFAVGVFWAIAFAFAIGVILSMVSGIVPNIVGQNIIEESIILGTLAKFDALAMLPSMS